MIPLRETPHARRYSVLYADPAWAYLVRSPAGLRKSPAMHYPTSSLAKMGKLPVAEVAAKDAWLFMWATWPNLQEAFELASLWSDPKHPWRYCTGGAWAKRPRNWKGNPSTWQMGTGYIFRSASEPLLVFRRGDPAWLTASARGLWVAPIRRHSEKPDEVRDMLIAATRGPRLEMFSRRAADKHFDTWGWEAKG